MGDFEACRFDFRLDAKNGLTPSKRKKSERRGTCYNTLFKCKICGSLFDHRAALLEHKMLHSEFKCTICDLKVARKVTLKEHLSVIHGLGRTKADYKVAQQAAKLAELAAARPSPLSAPPIEIAPLPTSSVPASPAIITSPSTMPGYMCINIPLLMPPSGGQQDNTTVVSSAGCASPVVSNETPSLIPVAPGSTGSTIISPQHSQLIGQPPVSTIPGNAAQGITSSSTPCNPILTQETTLPSSQTPTSLGYGQQILPDMDDLEPGEIRPIYRNMFQGQIQGMAPLPIIPIASAASASTTGSSSQPSFPSTSASITTTTVPVAAIQPTARNIQPPPPYRPETNNVAPNLPVFVPNVSSGVNPPPPYSMMNIPVAPPPYTQNSGQPTSVELLQNNGMTFLGIKANQEVSMHLATPTMPQTNDLSLKDSNVSQNLSGGLNCHGSPKQDHLRLPVFIAASEPDMSPIKTEASPDDDKKISSESVHSTVTVDFETPLDLSSSRESIVPLVISPDEEPEPSVGISAPSGDVNSAMIVERIRAMERIARQEGFSNRWLLGKQPNAQSVPNIGSANPFLFQALPLASHEKSLPRPSSQPSILSNQIRPLSEPQLSTDSINQPMSRSLVSSPVLSEASQGRQGEKTVGSGQELLGKSGFGNKKRPRTGLNSMVARLWQTKIQRNSVEKETESNKNTDDSGQNSPVLNVDTPPMPAWSKDPGNIPDTLDSEFLEDVNVPPLSSPQNDILSPSMYFFSAQNMEQFDSSVTQMDGAGDSIMESSKSLPNATGSLIGKEELKSLSLGNVLDLTCKSEDTESHPGKIWIPNPALQHDPTTWSEDKISSKGRPRLEKMPIHRDPPRKRQKRDFYTVKFHTCKICRQLFDSAEEMWEHALQHEDFYKQKCSMAGCNFASLSKAELVRHRAEVHGEIIPDPLANPDGKEYVCSYCGKALSSASSLYHHVTRHAHEKQYVCDHSGCTWRFFTSRELKLHVDKVHLGKKTSRRYSCPREGCTREFTMLDRLKRHLLSHAAKPQQMFTCPEPGCDRSFRYQRRLKVHQLEHSGLTPEKCVLCEFSCKNQATLTWHMKTKHGLGKLKIENVPFPKEAPGECPSATAFMSPAEDNPASLDNSVCNSANTIKMEIIQEQPEEETLETVPSTCNEHEDKSVELASHSDLDHSDPSDLDLSLEGIDKESFYEALNLKLKSKVEAELAKQAERGSTMAGQAFSTMDGFEAGNDQLAAMRRWRWATLSETQMTTSVPLDQTASMSHFRWAPLNKNSAVSQGNVKEQIDSPAVSMSHFRWATHDKATAVARMSIKEQHERPMEGKLHCCKLCKQLFASSQKSWSHRLVEHDDVGQLFCDRCTFSTRRRQEMEEHCMVSHGCRPSSLKRIVCLTCGREYSSRHGLRQHQWKHHRNGNPEYPCPQDGCILSFPSRAALKSHFQQSHPKAPRDLKCTADGCHKMFNSNSALHSHQVLHLDQRPLVCDFPGCEKAFRESKHLKVHKMLHTDEKPLKCNLCEYSCRQRNSLNWHMKSKHNLQKQVTADGHTVYV